MVTRIAIIAVALLAVLATPILLRPTEPGLEQNADARLVIITPHNQTIRRVFSEAFARHIYDTTGQRIYIDWRVPGGTSEVRTMLNSEFSAADEHGREGVGIDLFFGGGSFDFDQQAGRGQLVPSRIFQDQQELFASGIVPASHTGELYYHPEGLWTGVCLSSFGIVSNLAECAALGLDDPPSRWADLADPRLVGRIALADPTKSGSVNKAFEMIIQEIMQRELAAVPEDIEDRERRRQAALSEGWRQGLQLIQRIGANARYFTDSSVQIPLDVAQGNAAAGMAIDFYGRTYEEIYRNADGSPRLLYVTPEGGSSISTDNIALLRGAPNHELAEAFIAFCLSLDGQRLWNTRTDAPHGPPHALRRLPLRTDMYTPEELQWFSDPEALPFERDGGFTYRAELTAPAFGALALIIRSMCLDSQDELKDAWRALIEADFPPQATRVFEDMANVSYDNAMGSIRDTLRQRDRIATSELQRRLVSEFRRNYRQAATLARQGL